MLEAVMSDRNNRVLQSPQVRVVDGQKASLKIGDRVPYSTGGFQPAFGQVGTGFNSLYSSFQFLDVGVNVDITPKVHGPNEVSLHIELDISNVRDRIDIGGIEQPVVGQRKVVHDIRLREGEVSLLGGLIQTQETKTVSGVPGLASIPLLRRLFTSESIEKNESELLIAIIPHVLRTPEFDAESYKGILSGSERVVRLSYARPRAEAPAAAPKPAMEEPAPAPAVPVPQPAKPETPAAPAPPGPPPPSESPKPEAAVPATPPLPTPAPAAQPSLVFAPAFVEAQPGSTVTLELQVANVSDLFDSPLRFKFDPSVLRLNEITRGPFLAGDGRQVIFTRNILNDRGEASVNLMRMKDAGGVSGSGVLVTLAFQVVGRGSAAVSAQDVTLKNSKAETILSASPQAAIQVK
jgi:general secretion pathway protein D